MFKKEFIVGLLVAFLSLVMVGTVFAGENDYANIIGSDEFTFDAPESKTDVVVNDYVVNDYVYDQEHLALAGTEAGDWEYKYDAPETKADVAARSHVYNQEHMALVGTEAGDWEYRSGINTGEATAPEGQKMDTLCATC